MGLAGTTPIERAVRALAGMAGVALVVASCGGAESGGPATADTPATTSEADTSTTPPPSPPAGAAVIEFTWTTSYVGDGYGVRVEVSGSVGEGWASYTMHAVPVLGSDGGEYADLIPTMVGTGINGFADRPSGPGAIDPNGATEVVVDGDDRWYRLPWLLEEAPFALEGAEWVLVDASSDTPPIDLATYVVAERFDQALAELRRAAASGATFTPAPGGDEIAAFFGPWVGADGAIEPTGDDAEGEARWGVSYTYEPDGIDGFARGEVSWHTMTGKPPRAPAPDRSITAERVSTAIR